MTLTTAKDFGATGDGTTNDTTALQSWLNDPSPGKILPPGVYRITAGLTCSRPDVHISGGGTILADTAEIDVLALTGDGATVRGITINGSDKARYGIYAKGARTVIESCHVHNLYSTSSPRGIFTETLGSVTIRDNHIRNVSGPGDATLGNGAGMSRGIVVYSPGPATAPSVCSGNVIENVTGEEADGIAVLASDTVGNIYDDSWARITGNTIRNAARRYVKVQASNVVVDANWCYNMPGFTATNASNGIDIIQGSRIRITGNTVEDSILKSPISVVGPSSTERVVDIEISGNRLVEADLSNPVIYAVNVNRMSVIGNHLEGGTYGLNMGTADDLLATGNVFRGGVSGNPAFQLLSSVKGKVHHNSLGPGKTPGTSANVWWERNA